jgi:hypothetical protein
MKEERMSGWTQPVCVDCWNHDNPASPAPWRDDLGEPERCCKCGARTCSGIYIRVDPAVVALTMRVLYEYVRGTIEPGAVEVAAECMNDMPYPDADTSAVVVDLAYRHLAVLAADYGRKAL